MARRDRTTGLPRPQRRERGIESTRERGWLPEKDQLLRHGLLVAAVLMAVITVGVFAFRWYDDNFLRPNKTVLAAGDDTYSLGYFADRLGPFFLANPSTTQSIAPQALLAKLEEEALTIQVAAARNIALDDDAVTAAIADELGVPVGSGTGSAFDGAYRARLNATGLSDGNYRRVVEAAEVDRLLREDIQAGFGETGETVMLRLVVVDTQEQADAILARINAGEDMGSIAQVESIHVQSRVEDGLFISPPKLLSEEVQAAIEGLEVGALVEPFESDGVLWIVRLERRDAEGTYTEEQLDALVQLEFDELLSTFRLTITIDRNLSSDDINWALEKSTIPTQPLPTGGGHGG